MEVDIAVREVSRTRRAPRSRERPPHGSSGSSSLRSSSSTGQLLSVPRNGDQDGAQHHPATTPAVVKQKAGSVGDLLFDDVVTTSRPFTDPDPQPREGVPSERRVISDVASTSHSDAVQLNSVTGSQLSNSQTMEEVQSYHTSVLLCYSV